MTNIRFATSDDGQFWFALDQHLPKEEFANKIREHRAYILSQDGNPAGLLRYNLFWDNTPFCTMLIIDAAFRGRGYGRQLMEHWECEMASRGYGFLLVSTQVDESAQCFYRKLGYKDCGAMVVDVPGYEQPLEMFLQKPL